MLTTIRKYISLYWSLTLITFIQQLFVKSSYYMFDLRLILDLFTMQMRLSSFQI